MHQITLTPVTVILFRFTPTRLPGHLNRLCWTPFKSYYTLQVRVFLCKCVCPQSNAPQIQLRAKNCFWKIKGLASGRFPLFFKLFISSIHLRFTLRPKVQNNPNFYFLRPGGEPGAVPFSSELRGFFLRSPPGTGKPINPGIDSFQDCR